MTSEWIVDPVGQPNQAVAALASARQRALTKPAGSLGRLEAVAIRLAALQGRVDPAVDRVHITVFAADHGVAVEGVSVYPQEVTAQMLANFASGGAAISVLARELNARLEVVDVGTVTGVSDSVGVIDARVVAGSGNIRQRDAMTGAACDAAMQVGRQAAERAAEGGAELFIGGDMGIANTTAAATLGCALLRATPGELAGPGTGLDDAGVGHKSRVIGDALSRHPDLHDRPVDALCAFGGLEIAGLAGSYLRCAQLGTPVLIDGFITTAAALLAVRLRPEIRQWLMFSHRSAEPGHQALLRALGADPLLDLGMRLGEGSGAAILVPIMRLACALHNGMATFKEAGVSGG